jgi:tRNA pseudouridine13 synthase
VTSSSPQSTPQTSTEPAVVPFGVRPLPGFAEQPRPSPAEALPAGAPIFFRGDDDGFLVDEVPLYLPSGQGEHLYLHVEKRGVSTPELWKRLRGVFGVKEVEIGTAGMKDARGVTRQWISVPARVVEPRVLADRAAVEAALGVALLAVQRHGNKLRTGHLRGNRFVCRLDGVDAGCVAALSTRAARLAATGLPNWFGAQRFGPEDRALRDAERWLLRRRPAQTKREQFWVSAVQSVLFNDWLALRVDDGSWDSVVVGDVCEKRMPDGRGGPLFVCEDATIDAPRAARGEISAAGPLYGQQMRTAGSDALTRESRSLERLGIDRDGLLSHPAFATGARRSARLLVDDLVVHTAGNASSANACRVSFVLPPGAYASVVLAELVGPRLVDLAFTPTGPVVDAAAGRAES